jgi:glycosyltransferase involved in cell wall biosynthesis
MKCISLLTFTLNSEEDLDRLLRYHEEIVDEIIIIDSYSTDSTLEVAKKYGAKIFQEKNKRVW